MTPTDRIRALRLTDNEKLEVHKDRRIVLGLDYDTDIADAQYDKLLRGLIEWLEEINPDDNYLAVNASYGMGMVARDSERAATLRQALKETARVEPSG